MVVAVEDIKDSESLRDWLKDRPIEDARLIAFRAALRVFPLIRLDRSIVDFERSIVLPAFRTLAGTRLFAIWPNSAQEAGNAYRLAIDGITKVDTYTRSRAKSANKGLALGVGGRSTTNRGDSGRAATTCATTIRAIQCAANTEHSESARLAVEAAKTAVSVAFRHSSKKELELFWAGVQSDAQRLENGAMYPAVGTSELWTAKAPQTISKTWQELSTHLESFSVGWEVWIQWYQDIINGKPADEETQLQIALIPEEVWNQGAKVVNAEVARILGFSLDRGDAERTVQAEPHREEASDPELPPRELSPVHFVFTGEVVDAEPATAPEVAPNRARLVQQGWAALRNLISDFQELGGGHQDRQLSRILERCLQAMGATYDDLDIVALGLAQDQLNQKATRAHDEMLSGSADQLVILNVQVKLFLQQSSDWDLYRTGLGAELGPEEEEIEALPHLSNAVQAMASIQSQAAQEKLDELREAVMLESTPDDPTPIPAPLPRRSYLRAGQDFLLTVFGAILSPVGEGLNDGTKKLVAAAVVGAAIHIGALAGALPSQFAWATPIIQHITKTFAK